MPTKKLQNPYAQLSQLPAPPAQTHANIPQIPALPYNTMSRSFFRQFVGPANPVIVQQPAHGGGAPGQNPYEIQGVKSVNPVSKNIAGTQEFFNNEVVFYCELNTAVLDECNKGQIKKITEIQLREQLMMFLYYPVISEMEQWINRVDGVVPRDSGKLRNNMLMSIRGAVMSPGTATYTRIGNIHPFVIVLNAGNCDYAKYVNIMPREWLQHSWTKHQWGNRSRTHKGRMRTPAKLFDPNAQPGFFEIIADKGRDKAQDCWDHYINNVLYNQFQNLFPYPINTNPNSIARSLFTWRFN